jgi:hypothetical protein
MMISMTNINRLMMIPVETRYPGLFIKVKTRISHTASRHVIKITKKIFLNIRSVLGSVMRAIPMSDANRFILGLLK